MRSSSLFAVGIAALLAGACAHERETIVEVREVRLPTLETQFQGADEPAAASATSAVPAPTRLRRPDAAYARIARSVPGPSDAHDTVDFPHAEGGYAIEELFKTVAREARVTIRYENNSAVIKSRPLTFVGDQRVPRSRLVSWLQTALFPLGLVLVPQGLPAEATYAAMDQANANVSTASVFIPEDDLPRYAGRSGMYITSLLTLPAGADTQRVRTALAQQSTKTAGLGRVSDLGAESSAILVCDFAPIVAVMRRALDAMEIAAYEAQQH